MSTQRIIDITVIVLLLVGLTLAWLRDDLLIVGLFAVAISHRARIAAIEDKR